MTSRVVSAFSLALVAASTGCSATDSETVGSTSPTADGAAETGTAADAGADAEASWVPDVVWDDPFTPDAAAADAALETEASPDDADADGAGSIDLDVATSDVATDPISDAWDLSSTFCKSVVPGSPCNVEYAQCFSQVPIGGVYVRCCGGTWITEPWGDAGKWDCPPADASAD